MYRLLVYADPHWSQYTSIVRSQGKKYSTRLENLIDSINWVERLAEETKCDEIVSLGDFFDRASLNAAEVSALQEIRWSEIDHTFIVGNHESNVNSLEFSTTKYFESIGGVVVSDNQSVEISDKVVLHYLPYSNGDIDLKTIVDKTKKNIVMAHLDIAGIQYGVFTSQAGVPLQDIVDNCTLFLDGHLHNEMILHDKIILVGNLTGKNFTENSFTYKHQVCIVTIEDDGKIAVDFIENPKAMNFYKIIINSVNDLQKLDRIKSNSVLSLICHTSMVDLANQKIKTVKDKIAEYRFTITYDTAFSSDSESFVGKPIDFISQFITCAKEKFESSSILDDELSRLEAN